MEVRGSRPEINSWASGRQAGSNGTNRFSWSYFQLLIIHPLTKFLRVL